MPGMEDAFKSAGFSGAAKRKCETCGKEFVPKDPKHRDCYECFRKGGASSRGREQNASPVFPERYPEYFDSDGILKCDYVADLAQSIAQRLGTDRLTPHQLRAFYGQVKRLQAALKSGRPFKEIQPEVCKLKAFAEEHFAKKRRIPESFRDFILRNVDAVKSHKDFVAGFVEHFQAVVAYSAGTIQPR